jgi:hypothetical protein
MADAPCQDRRMPFGHGRGAGDDGEHQQDHAHDVVEVAYVPLWVSELVRTALEDHGISAHVFEEHLLPGYGLPMVRIVVRADQRDAAADIVDAVTATSADSG